MDGFITTYVWPGAIILAQSLLVLVALLLFIAYILYADRKIWAAVQLRRGPNVVGPWGLLQSFADLLKFVFKEPVIPSGANKAVFLLAPLVAVTLALAAWAVIPVDAGWVIADINVGILFVFAISSLEVYGVIMAGWASNSKYPFLGALRSAAQMVSYEVSIGFVIVTVLLCVGSLNLTDIVMAQADRHRHPDGPAELVVRLALAATVPDVHHLLHFGAGRDQPSALRPAGSRIGTGGGLHGRVRLHALHDVHARRVCAIVLMCALTTILFLGGWLPPLDSRRSPGCRASSGSCSRQPRVLHVLHGEGLRAALPLRPADAAWLESVPADFAGHGGDRGRVLKLTGTGRDPGPVFPSG
jgi:NADH-quinone oxidoreductase subunit H